MPQKNNFKTERAAICDAADIAEIEKLCFSAPWSENAVCETMSQPTAVFIKAVCEGVAAAYIGSYSSCDTCYITNVAVRPEFRRRGMASALIEALKSESEKLSEITLEVRVGNEAAISLYKKHGFSVCGKRPRFYSAPEEDAYIMTYNFGKETAK